jgi:MFS family permease
MSWRRYLVLAVIASLAVTAALAIGILLLGDFGDTEARVLATTFAISVMSLLALPGAQLLDQERFVPLAWATVALAALAFVVFEHTIWTDEDSSDAWKRVGTAAAFAVATTQIAALTSRLKADDRQAVRTAYFVAVSLGYFLAVLATAAMWEEIESEGFYRMLAALAVLNVFLVVLQPLLRRLGGEPAMYRVRIDVKPGGSQELELAGRDFAAALADGVRRAEREGGRVMRVERL